MAELAYLSVGIRPIAIQEKMISDKIEYDTHYCYDIRSSSTMNSYMLQRFNQERAYSFYG